jgi:hypothetical protein
MFFGVYPSKFIDRIASLDEKLVRMKEASPMHYLNSSKPNFPGHHHHSLNVFHFIAFY